MQEAIILSVEQQIPIQERARRQYTKTDVKIIYRGKLLHIFDVLVSASGVWKIFLDGHDRTNMGHAIDVEVLGVHCQGRLVREEGSGSVHYNLRFVQMEEAKKIRLREQIEQNGFPPPWQRQYPRLVVQNLDHGLPCPSVAMVKRMTGLVHADVVNFTVNGILLEFATSGISLGERVGIKVDFDLYASDGRQINGIGGEIARIFDEQINHRKYIRSLGLKLLFSDERQEKLYRNLIANYCQLLRISAER
jgi:hypothetical protein